LSSAAGRNYSVKKEEEKLTLRTPAFRTELESLLHSGIYNREFSSVLAAAVIAGIVFVIVAMNTGTALIQWLAFLIVFTVGFPLFRALVFKEIVMEIVFDRSTGQAEVSVIRIKRRLKEVVPLSSIKDIFIESRKRKVENRDAVEFVEKISLQHGTVIPGFGKETVIFFLKLLLSDGSERIIFSDDRMQDVITAHDEIKEFLKL
jgi:hypothetical protein